MLRSVVAAPYRPVRKIISCCHFTQGGSYKRDRDRYIEERRRWWRERGVHCLRNLSLACLYIFFPFAFEWHCRKLHLQLLVSGTRRTWKWKELLKHIKNSFVFQPNSPRRDRNNKARDPEELSVSLNVILFHVYCSCLYSLLLCFR